MKNKSNQRKGYILIESLLYINAVFIISLSLALIIFFSIKMYKDTIIINDLKETALVVEDRIKYDIRESIGFDSFRVDNSSKANQKFLKDGYKKIKILYYNSYDSDNGNLICKKKIINNNNTISIGVRGQYQIGNYVKAMYIKEKKDEKEKVYKVSFIIVYENKNREYSSYFDAYF